MVLTLYPLGPYVAIVCASVSHPMAGDELDSPLALGVQPWRPQSVLLITLGAAQHLSPLPGFGEMATV